MIDTFFNATVDAIRKEEQELNQLFNINKDLYRKHHHGVCILYETTFVYLVFKELLKRDYPFMIFWEYPYPGNKKEHSDLALLNKDGELEALIEFKIWTQDDDRKIKADIEKLQKETGCTKYIVVIGYGGDINENNEYLLKQNPSLMLIGMKGLTTSFFKTKLDRLEDNELNIYMYEVK